MKVVGYKQPQPIFTKAKDGKADKQKADGKNGGNKPNNANKDAKQDGGDKPAEAKSKADGKKE